jgi:hypothetical protein
MLADWDSRYNERGPIEQILGLDTHLVRVLLFSLDDYP